jgi:hypothetical protein
MHTDVFAKSLSVFRDSHNYKETRNRIHGLPYIHCIYGLHFTALCLNVGITMNVPLEFRRRIGEDPHANGAKSVGCDGCPDIWELTNGDFAVIGIDITDEARKKLPPTAGCGPDERIVRLPRNLLVNAKRDIPN